MPREKLVLCTGTRVFDEASEEPVLQPISHEFSEEACTETGNGEVVPTADSYDLGSPGDTFRGDVHALFPMLWDDTKGVMEWRNAAIVGVGLAGALALRSSVDDDVRDWSENHEERWGAGGDVLSYLGEAYVQWPAWAGLYAYSLHSGNEELYDVSRSMFSTLVLTSVSTLAIKGIANTDRPTSEFNGGQFGFPSYHTASSFALAGVIDEYYGCRAGLPAYVLAGMIGFSRIDHRDHDLSDVVFGAVLGAVIGKSVARYHHEGDGRFQISPWYDSPNDATGVVFEKAF